MSKAIAAYRASFGRVFIYQLDREMVVHAHREGHLLFYLDGAAAQMVVDGKTYPLQQGKGVAVSPWQPHYFRPLAQKGNQLNQETLLLVLYINPAWFLEVSKGIGTAFRFGRTSIETVDFLRQAKLKLLHGLMDPLADNDGLEEAFRQLAWGSYEQSWQWMEEDKSLFNQLGTQSDYRIRKSLQYMSMLNLEDVDMNELAREVGMSRPHFFRLFRTQVGVTPNVYLNVIRMERAIDRLLNTKDSVADIGFDLGFSSQASFTRFFIANGVLPPSEYRRVVAQQQETL